MEYFLVLYWIAKWRVMDCLNIEINGLIECLVLILLSKDGSAPLGEALQGSRWGIRWPPKKTKNNWSSSFKIPKEVFQYNHPLPPFNGEDIFFSSSLHLSSWPAAWVTFNGDSSNWPYFLLQPTFLNVSCLTRPPIRRLSCFLSLFHILRIKSLVHALKAWDRVHFERARSRVSGRSRAFVPVSFPIRSIYICKELAAGFDLSPFQKNVQKSYVLPQDHGALGNQLLLYFLKLYF